MKVLNLKQGSGDWLRHRATCLNASDAPAMMGVSPYRSRADLVRERATGIQPEHDPSTLARFRAGHEAEANIRPYVEQVIGIEMYPVVGEQDFDGQRLSASFDGLSMDGSIGFEHKIWNEDLAASVREGAVPETHIWQVVHQHAVGALEKTLFVVSDGTPEKCVWCWVTTTPEQIARLLAGWKQFTADVAAYRPEPAAAESVATEPEALPAVFVQVEGRVVAGNMRTHRATVAAWVAALPSRFETDQDFADGAAAVKHCEKAESELKALVGQIRGQMASVDEVFRLIEDSVAEIAAARIRIDKAVKAEKEARKSELVIAARKEMQSHIDAINARLGGTIVQQPIGAVFSEAIKGLKSLSSMRDKLGATLAGEKIAADQIADTVLANLRIYDEIAAEYEFLFRDLHDLARTPSAEGFSAIVQQRIDRHKAEQAAKLEAERERIRAEEQAKAEREARAKMQAEQERLAQEQAKQDQRGKSEVAQREPEVRIGQDQVGEKESTPPIDDTGATLKLGDICARLGFTVTSQFMALLGFEPVAHEKNAKLYRAADFARICAALVHHITNLEK